MRPQKLYLSMHRTYYIVRIKQHLTTNELSIHEICTIVALNYDASPDLTILMIPNYPIWAYVITWECFTDLLFLGGILDFLVLLLGFLATRHVRHHVELGKED